MGKGDFSDKDEMGVSLWISGTDYPLRLPLHRGRTDYQAISPPSQGGVVKSFFKVHDVGVEARVLWAREMYCVICKKK